MAYQSKGVVASLCFFFLILIFGCSNLNREWENAKRANTVEAYQLFLKNFPASPHEKEANERIQSLKWENTKKTNTITEFQEFIKTYSQDSHKDEALQHIKELLCGYWQLDSGSTASFLNIKPETSEFLNLLPDGNVYVQIEGIRWAKGTYELINFSQLKIDITASYKRNLMFTILGNKLVHTDKEGEARYNKFVVDTSKSKQTTSITFE